MRFRFLLLGLVVQVSGCALFATPPAPPPEPQEQPAEEPLPAAPEPVVETVRPTPVVPPPAATPEPPPPVRAPLVAVILTNRAPGYERIALALESRLPHTETYDLSDRSLAPRDAFSAIEASDAVAIVAVGLRAARFAQDFGKLPVVFTQVFNVDASGLGGEQVRGVAVIPPLALQIRKWQQVFPGLQSIGAIVGPGHDALIAEAEQATAAAGLQFHYRIANSDRETLYLFNRLLPEIDGYWLFPDNRVLSAGVLSRIVRAADRHHVQVAVFNDSLLRLGATLSTTADADDMAAVVQQLVDRIEAGDLADLPSLTPLTAVKLTAGSSEAAAVVNDTPSAGTASQF